MKRNLTIACSLAQKPRQGGHSWVLLQYILGFKQLGWNVLFIDKLTIDMCFDAEGSSCQPEQSLNWQVFESIMHDFGLQEQFALLTDDRDKYLGMQREQVIEHVRNSDFLMNIMGFLDDEEILGAANRRVFLDIDPGFGQMWHELDLADPFRDYHDHVTIGENIGRPDCGVPTCGLSWITTPQPVVLKHWPAIRSEIGDRMTSIMSWRGAYGPIDFRGKTYGLRVHEFRRFLKLPELTGQRFQLALNIHPDDFKDRCELEEHHWEILDPVTVAGNPRAYRRFIRGSAAEFMVAKNMYIDTRSGWFSDRSICYLASGKPVVAQNTGLNALYPGGEGLLLFDTVDEAVDAIGELQADYPRHARAARAIAEDYFESDKVLTTLLKKLNLA